MKTKLITAIFLIAFIFYGCISPGTESSEGINSDTLKTDELQIDTIDFGVVDSSSTIIDEEVSSNDLEFSDFFENIDGEKIDNLHTYGNVILKSNTKNIKELTENVSNCNLPSQIADLVQGSNIRVFKFDNKKQSEAKAFGFTGKIGKNEIVLVQEFARYGTFNCEGDRNKFGIGLRCFIYIKSINSKLNIDKLSAVAAHVELGNLKATYELVSVGFPMQGSVLANNLPPMGDYNVDNFSKLAMSFEDVLKTLNDNNKMRIQPVSMSYYN